MIKEYHIQIGDWWVGNNPSEKHDSQNENRPKKARNNISAEKICEEYKVGTYNR